MSFQPIHNLIFALQEKGEKRFSFSILIAIITKFLAFVTKPMNIKMTTSTLIRCVAIVAGELLQKDGLIGYLEF